MNWRLFWKWLFTNPVMWLCAAGLAGVGGCTACAATQTAKSYNRVTGSDVTPWEALWLDLEVETAPVEAAASEEEE